MNLEPVILNTVNKKSDEIKNEVAQQVASLKQDNAANKDEINAHTSAMKDEVATQITNETELTLIALTQQKEALVADNGTKRDEVNAVTQSAKEDVMAHVVKETDRVIEALQGVGIYGHSVVVTISTLSGRTITYNNPLIITPPEGCFVRIVTLYASNSSSPVILDLGYGKVTGSSNGQFTLLSATSGTAYRSSLAGSSFRIGGGVYRDNPTSTSSFDERESGANLLNWLDGAIGLPVKIFGTYSSGTSIHIAYEIRKMQ